MKFAQKKSGVMFESYHEFSYTVSLFEISAKKCIR